MFCQNWCAATHFRIFGLNLRNEDLGGGGGKSIHFWKGLFTGSPKISKPLPYELQEKSFCGRSLNFYVTYQPQAEMLLLLHLWKELLQI